MNCKELEQDLVSYVDGSLDDRRAGAVEAHIATCAHCQAESQAIRRTLRMAAAYRIPTLSDLSAVRMLAGVRARVERHRRARPHRLVPAFSAAAAALVLLVIGWKGWRSTGESPPAPEAGEVSSVEADRIAFVSEDPELFDAVLERLATLDVGGVRPLPAQQAQAPADNATPKSPASSDAEGAPLWQEYHRQHLQEAKTENLLKDLTDEELEQVLQKVEARLTV